MKVLFFSYAAILFLSSCIQETKSTTHSNKQIQEPSKTNQTSLSNLFTLPDAEKVLGEPAYLEDSSTKSDREKLIYQCAYKANKDDGTTERIGNVYFLIEQYAEVSLALEKYSFIKTANESHGIKVLNDVGDEAYFHSDGENFYFIMVRKGMKVFNMKVNKITSKTSLDQFNAIARQITTHID